MPIHVEIVTQEKMIFEELEADMVIVPGSEGEMGVLPRHAPLLTTLGYGELVVRKGRAEERFAVYGGVVDIRPGKVVVLADMAESSFDIDLAAVQVARDSATQLRAEGIPEGENRTAELALRRAELATRIDRKIKSRGSSVLRIIDDTGEEE